MTERCDGCYYWVRLGETDEGECRAKAPNAAALIPHPGMISLAVGAVAMWGRTKADKGCGDWRSKTWAKA